MPDQSARARLIGAAQKLFAARGYNGVSVRDIAAAAGVNSASVGYYFGGKENLLAEVYRMSCAPMVAERRALLAALQSAGTASLEDIIAAFIRPAFAAADAARDAGHEESGFLRLRAILSAENADILDTLTARNFDESSREMVALLAAALPHLPREVVLWRFHFLLGTIYYTAAGPHRIASLSGGLCDPSDAEATLRELVPFLAAGLRAG